MSQVKANSFTDASGGSNAVLYGVAAPANSMGFRNRIINGDMRINQRAFSGNITTAAEYTLDRWRGEGSVSNKFTVAQSSTAPTGFVNSALITSSAATSLAAGDYYMFYQSIEGLNCSDLGWGTASAATVTLSFWVRSSLTGTFAGTLNNTDATRSYPYTYTISAANTWEQKTITISGDTSGTWLTTNGRGIMVRFSLGVGTTYSGTAGAWAGATLFSATGATSVVGTNGATFYITGVQLEAGSVASPFERRDYGRELIMCQRYYAKLGSDGAPFGAFANGICNATNSGQGFLAKLPVTMRTQPTATFSGIRIYDGAAAAAVSSLSSVSACSTANTLGFDAACSASFLTTGRPGTLQGDNTTAAFLAASAEL